MVLRRWVSVVETRTQPKQEFEVTSSYSRWGECLCTPKSTPHPPPLPPPSSSFSILSLTIYSTKASVETLCVYRNDIFGFGSMKQLSFNISSNVSFHFLLSYHVTFIKMRILNSLNFLNSQSVRGLFNFLYDTLVLRGTWGEFHRVYCHVRVWHWSPVLWKWNYWKQ